MTATFPPQAPAITEKAHAASISWHLIEAARIAGAGEGRRWQVLTDPKTNIVAMVVRTKDASTAKEILAMVDSLTKAER